MAELFEVGNEIGEKSAQHAKSVGGKVLIRR